MAAELLHTGKFTETRLPHGTYAELRPAYQAYRRVRSQRTRTVNLLRGLLDGLFPEFHHVFKKVTGKTAPGGAHRLSNTGEDRHRTRRGVCPPRTAGLSWRPSAHEEASRHPHRGAVLGERGGHRGTTHRPAGAAVPRADHGVGRPLGTVTATFPESRFLLSIPGVGPLTVAGLLGELGAPTGYARAKQLVEMAGTNPIESESAGKRSRHSPMSKKGRSSLRWCRWMASVSLLRHNPDFAAWAEPSGSARPKPIR